jgi:putative DNA primase/helicase
VGLYGENPNGLLWIGGHADGWKGRTFSTPDAAARYALELDDRGGIGVYHRSTTLARVPDRRGDADDSAAAYYFALDADVRGPGHKAENLPAGREDIERLIEKAGFPAPTSWVFSGGGYYPQWRFAEPIDVHDAEMRAWVTESFTQISAHFLAAAGELGWKLDNVRDLARVFRLPGTTNRKTDEHVIAELISADGDAHDLGVLASLARPSRGVVISRSAPATDPMPQAQDLVDDAARQFTRAQAVARVNGEGAKLKEVTSGFNAAINSFAMTCAHFPWLIDREKCGELMIKWLGKRQGWDAPDRDDVLTINSAYSATEAGKSWVAVESAAAAMPADSTGDDDSAHLSSPLEPMRVAREVLALLPRPLSWWRGAYYEHHGRHWAETSDDAIRKAIYLITENATYTGRDSNGDPAVKRWAPNAAKVSNVHDALSRGVTQIEGEAVTCMAMENGVLDPITREMAPHGPDRFNLSYLPFGYDPGAACPEWLAFLESSLPGDGQAHETLAEWFGYVLSGRTDLHKIGVLVGPPRCGKGTISRVLKAMVGQDGWAAPTLSRLGSEFGLASLIGKSLAVMGDVRWTSKHVIDAVPIMLGVSGEDGFTVSRKHVTDWIGKLDARLMLMSNDAPVFTDASGALAGRMVYVAFHRSFLGREDLELEGRLMRELPGILNWALTGLDRITKHGMFTQSAASNELREEVDRDSSPVKAWADDRCLMDPEAEFSLAALLSNYRDWLTEEHMTFAPSASRFSRDLRSAFADQGVTVDRKPNGVGGKHRVVTGIRPIAGASFATGLVD